MSRNEPRHPDAHEETRLLLPWLANGTLASEEVAAAERHLAHCAECRDELAGERRLVDLVRAAPAVAPAPHPVQLARLRERIERESGDGNATPRGPRASHGSRWRAVALAQAAAIVLLLGALAFERSRREEAPAFRTLSDAPASAPAAGRLVRVVFADSLDQRGVRDLLLPLGAEIVAGPSPLGVYTIALPTGASSEPLAWVIAHLREQPAVRFAEPVAADDRP